MTESHEDGASDGTDNGAQTRDFGFRRVALDEHARLVRGVFESVAARYDLMNDLMSGGLHRLWKAALVDWLAPRPATMLLDLAGGTGDVALRVLDRLGPAGGGAAIVCDVNPAMLAEGRDRAIDNGRLDGLGFLCADAACLPLPERRFDYVTIAFGLRNVTRRGEALAEARRVLRPGGRFLCLEFSRVMIPALRPLYDAYSFRLLPALGQAVAGDRDAYQYLVESIRRFPDQETLAEEMRRAGFAQLRWRNLSGGIVALHSGWRV